MLGEKRVGRPCSFAASETTEAGECSRCCILFQAHGDLCIDSSSSQLRSVVFTLGDAGPEMYLLVSK